MKLKSLKNQIFIYFSLFMFLIIIITSILFFYSFSNIATKQIIKSTQNAVAKSGENLELYIEQIDYLSHTLEKNKVVTDFFEKETFSKASQIASEEMLQNVVAVRNEVVSIVLVGRDGRIVSNEKDIPMELSKDMMNMQWYENTIKNNGKLFLTSARMQDFTLDKNTWVISTSREITDDYGENIGVLLIDLKYNFVENFVENIDLGKDGYLFIMNDRGQLVYSKDTECFTDKDKTEQLKELAFSQDLTHGNLSVTRYHLKNADWELVALTSLDSVSMLKEDIFNVIIVSITILVLLSLLITFTFAKKIIYPLSLLEASMLKVENGDFNVQLYKTKIKEIESLSTKFQSMLTKIQALMEDIKIKEQIQRESELFALQSQINPHFLYNSLETIIWMAEFKNVEKVISLTSALSKFFRLSLKSGNGTTKLGDEVEHIKQYLYIQGYRYENIIKYSIDIDENLYSLEVPKLILQPIVENAIDHGLRRLKESDNPILILNSKVNKNGDIVIEVIDNGKGFDCPKDYKLPDKETNANEKLQLKNKIYGTHSKSTGIGMKNVARRINLFYGDNYGIIINSSTKGTIVNLILKNKQYRE